MKHNKLSESAVPKDCGTSSAPSPASLEARRQAAAILEVLAGMHRPLEAAQLLGTSLMRYYQLERRALEGLVAACEPPKRGPRLNPQRQLAALQREKANLARECDRQRALVRAAQRALGLKFPSPTHSAGKPPQEPAANGGTLRRRPRRPVVRALRAIKELQLRAEDTATIGNTTPAEPAGKAREVHQIDWREVYDDSIGSEAARRCACQITEWLGPLQAANDVVPADARRRMQRRPGLPGTGTEPIAVLRAPRLLAAAIAGTAGAAVARPAFQT